MKVLIVLAIGATAAGAIVFSLIAFPKSALTQQRNTSVATQRESPFACDRTALTPEVRKRHFEELGPTLISLRKSVRELSDGYEFEFPKDEKTYQLLTEWAFQERLCCPFFDLDYAKVKSKIGVCGSTYALKLTSDDTYIRGES